MIGVYFLIDGAIVEITLFSEGLKRHLKAINPEFVLNEELAGEITKVFMTPHEAEFRAMYFPAGYTLQFV